MRDTPHEKAMAGVWDSQVPGPFVFGMTHPVVVPHVMGFLDPPHPITLCPVPSRDPQVCTHCSWRVWPAASLGATPLSGWLLPSRECSPSLHTRCSPGENPLLGMLAPDLHLNCWASEFLCWPCECHLLGMACSLQLSRVCSESPLYCWL